MYFYFFNKSINFILINFNLSPEVISDYKLYQDKTYIFYHVLSFLSQFILFNNKSLVVITRSEKGNVYFPYSFSFCGCKNEKKHCRIVMLFFISFLFALGRPITMYHLWRKEAGHRPSLSFSIG